MKKIINIIYASLFTLASSHAYATGLFVGADAAMANARHKAINSSSESGPKNGSVQDDDHMGYGLNTGLRIDFLNALASGEVFYDNLDVSSTNFESTSSQINSGDSINIKSRAGVKLNAGFAILPKVTPFLTYGLASVRYSNNIYSSGNFVSKSELSPIYGAGILFDLPFGISAKASYDYQRFNIRYAEEGAKIKTHLGVLKLGVIYNF